MNFNSTVGISDHSVGIMIMLDIHEDILLVPEFRVGVLYESEATVRILCECQRSQR